MSVTVDHGDGRLPLNAVVIRDSQEITVDTSKIMKNDVVKVVAGGRLPVALCGSGRDPCG